MFAFLLELPPHTRGWTLYELIDPEDGDASPAHAGMDPGRRRAGGRHDRFPRTRGDGPRTPRRIANRRRLPPHTRGWTRSVPEYASRTGASPAHAGMDPEHRGRPLRLWCFPRTRGDGPCSRPSRSAVCSLPPHTRGWTPAQPAKCTQAHASPAHAGMDPRLILGALASIRFPRTRGDGPLTRPVCLRVGSLPPHTRGWTVGVYYVNMTDGASPAHAGMDPRGRAVRHRLRCFPRTRGDGPFGRSSRPRPAVLPPHTRGWTLRSAGGRTDIRASPAHAGMDLDRPAPDQQVHRFPRTRGDGPGPRNDPGKARRLPPHTRGWTMTMARREAREWASPAHAGMDLQHTLLRYEGLRFPRTRGDGPW